MFWVETEVERLNKPDECGEMRGNLSSPKDCNLWSPAVLCCKDMTCFLPSPRWIKQNGHRVDFKAAWRKRMVSCLDPYQSYCSPVGDIAELRPAGATTGQGGRKGIPGREQVCKLGHLKE